MSKKNIPESVVFYAAGLIDGEGTITMSKQSSRSQFRTPVVSCSSTTPEILDFLKENFGGTISKHKTYQDHHKQSWSWKLTNDGALDLCHVLRNHLLEPTKRYRADLLASGYKLVTRRNGKYKEEEKIAKLEFERRFFNGG